MSEEYEGYPGIAHDFEVMRKQRDELLAALRACSFAIGVSLNKELKPYATAWAGLKAGADSVIASIEQNIEYGCHLDLEPHMKPDACVLDAGRPQDCIYTKDINNKHECKYWKPITAASIEQSK